MSFLTVEDVNGILFNYSKINSFYEVNTSLIMRNEEFEDIMYDFVNVSHTIDNDEHTFSFEIYNDLWCGGYYFTNQYGNYLQLDATYANGVLTVTTYESDIILVLYLNNLFTEFSLERLSFKPAVTSENMFFTLINEANNPIIYYLVDYLEYGVEMGSYGLLSAFYNGSWESVGLAFIEDDYPDESFKFAISLRNLNINKNYTVFKIVFNNNTFYFTRTNIKHILPINIVVDGDEFVLGKVNEFTVESSENLLDYITDIKLHYNNQIYPVNFYRPTKLDLTNKVDTKDVNFKIVVTESAKIKGYEYNFQIPCRYTLVNSKSQLQNELDIGGSSVIEIGNDFTLNPGEYVHIKHDIIIKGNFNTINMNNCSFIVDEGVTVIFQDLKFYRGNPIFIQEENSDLTLDNCYFINANASNFNGLGSVIHCNIDKTSLEEQNDFKTNVNNCIFDNINTTTAIFHGGELKVDKCKVKTTELSYQNYNAKIPWFLYQTDGNAILTNNIFDLNVETNDLCSHGRNIGYYQALLHCGLNATINNASWGSLKENNTLPFFDSHYNNKSHLFVKYYSNQVHTCLFASPELGYEDKACCHTISNVDYVFKNNVKLTNSNWHSENNLKKFSIDLSWGGG